MIPSFTKWDLVLKRTEVSFGMNSAYEVSSVSLIAWVILLLKCEMYFLLKYIGYFSKNASQK